MIEIMQNVVRNRVLLVDDNPSMRRSLRLRFERAGIEVAEAENGRQSIGMAQDYCPRVIILDFRMPEMNGLEVAPHLKRLLPRIVHYSIHDAFGRSPRNGSTKAGGDGSRLEGSGWNRSFAAGGDASRSLAISPYYDCGAIASCEERSQVKREQNRAWI